MSTRPFLTARWLNLCLFNFTVDEPMIAPRLPRGFNADLWQGRAFVSVVAFQFLETRVMGLRWPGLVDFPEVNLRTYAVAPDGRRGVVFIREYVPSRLVGWVARAVYNEPYAAAPMAMRVSSGSGCLRARYALGRGARLGEIDAEVEAQPLAPPEPGSLEHHFKEHQWGFGVSRRGRALIYEVRHPAWRVHRVLRARCELDWARLYGAAWGVMNGREPDSVVFAEGSAVEVFPGATQHL